ncbi:MAG TPA: hypothetical protein VNJ12_09465 [Candidatus Dormibacteraeota bacterium]|nr:hypothetical protein [Candidatus Dormibacteraeota bacterium]
MPLVWTILAVFGAFFLFALLLLAAMLFSPLVFSIDSGKGQARVCWLGALEYSRPFPPAEGKAELRFAGKSLSLPARRAKRKRRPAAPGPRKAGKRATAARFLRRCLCQPEVRRILVKRIGRLAKGMLRSVAWTGRQVNLSLPDPAWNGMLAGWLAQRHGGRGSAVRVNFTGENELFLEVRVYPYRIATALLIFSAGLPYRALLREWRAASAIVS